MRTKVRTDGEIVWQRRICLLVVMEGVSRRQETRGRGTNLSDGVDEVVLGSNNSSAPVPVIAEKCENQFDECRTVLGEPCVPSNFHLMSHSKAGSWLRSILMV